MNKHNVPKIIKEKLNVILNDENNSVIDKIDKCLVLIELLKNHPTTIELIDLKDKYNKKELEGGLFLEPLYECIEMENILMSSKRASDLKKIWKYENGMCLMQGSIKPDIIDMTEEERKYIVHLWKNCFNGSASISTVVGTIEKGRYSNIEDTNNKTLNSILKETENYINS